MGRSAPCRQGWVFLRPLVGAAAGGWPENSTMTRVFNFSPGPAALPEAGAAPGRRRNARLARLGHVGDGDEPPRQGVHLDPCRGRGAAAQAAGGAGELQGAVHAGRRDRRERDRAAEHAARQNGGRLHRHRRVVQEVDQGGAEVLHRQRRCLRQGQRLHQRPGARELEARPRTPPTCTSAPTRPSVASSTTARPTSAACRWWPTCRPTSCRGRSTCRSTA